MLLLRRLLLFIILIAIITFGVLFTMQNTATAPLDLLVIQLAEKRVALWVLCAFAIGGLLGVIVTYISVLRLRSELILTKRKLQKHEKELDQLRLSSVKE